MSAPSKFRERIDSVLMDGSTVLAINCTSAAPGGSGNVLIRCPVHDDNHPSCSVNLKTGKAHCFGCGWVAGDVVALHKALGRFPTMGDALRDLEARSGGPLPPLRIFAASTKRQSGTQDKPKGQRTIVKSWVYHLSNGGPAFEVHRIQWLLPGGAWFQQPGSEKPYKIYQPKAPGSARYGMPPGYSGTGTRPLYALPELIAADPQLPVYVVEGEPAADAIRSIGWVATTSSGGAAAPGKTDWTPLAGRRVILWPDNDEAGKRYASKVCDILVNLPSEGVIQRVDVDRLDLPIGGDAVDWLQRRRDQK